MSPRKERGVNTEAIEIPHSPARHNAVFRTLSSGTGPRAHPNNIINNRPAEYSCIRETEPSPREKEVIFAEISVLYVIRDTDGRILNI